jgi:hypothetical protein
MARQNPTKPDHDPAKTPRTKIRKTEEEQMKRRNNNVKKNGKKKTRTKRRCKIGIKIV